MSMLCPFVITLRLAAKTVLEGPARKYTSSYINVIQEKAISPTAGGLEKNAAGAWNSPSNYR
jgi:hypothetical protein